MQTRFVVAFICAVLVAAGLPVTAIGQTVIDPASWEGMQAREWQQTRPVHAHPTDFHLPQETSFQVWHVTICDGDTGKEGALKLPVPTGYTQPSLPAPGPNDGNAPAHWRTTLLGDDGSVQIEAHGLGETDLSVSYKDPNGHPETRRIHVVVIKCDHSNVGQRGLQVRAPTPVSPGAAPQNGNNGGGGNGGRSNFNVLVPLVEGGGLFGGGHRGNRDRRDSKTHKPTEKTDTSKTTPVTPAKPAETTGDKPYIYQPNTRTNE